MAPDEPRKAFYGRVRIGGDGRVEWVKARRHPPSDGTTHLDVGDSFVYPGLVDLHSHLGFAGLPLWREPRRQVPWLHRDLWPGAESYKRSVSWPTYAYLKGAPEALLAYAQVRALAGGTTAIQGWPPANRSPVNKLIRNVDDDFDASVVRTSVVNLGPAELMDRGRRMDEGSTLIYHLAEGQRDSIAAREFDDAARARCLRHRLIAIHCTAVDEPEFEQWQQLADVDDRAVPGGIVWSPFSNLWLYGQTTKVEAALRHGVAVCIGSDWAPSGSKNLLGELKVAKLWAEAAGLEVDDHDLVSMVTAIPGDLLGRAWGSAAPGRLVPGGLGDLVVVARRRVDPWANLVQAREQDVELVVVDGRPVYGTRGLMRAAGVVATTAVGIGRERRHVTLRDPAALSRTWTWSRVCADLARVAANPHAAIRRAHEALASAPGPLSSAPPTAAGRGPGASAGGVGPLVLESDMPGGPHAVAGPPPPGAVFTMKPPPSLVHDATWHRSIPEDGFDGGLLPRLAEFYKGD